MNSFLKEIYEKTMIVTAIEVVERNHGCSKLAIKLVVLRGKQNLNIEIPCVVCSTDDRIRHLVCCHVSSYIIKILKYYS